MHTPDSAMGLRTRLFERVAASADAARVMHTRRFATAPRTQRQDSAVLTELYRAAPGELRPGQPRRVRLLQLPARASWQHDGSAGGHAEWLVLQGAAQLGDHTLGELGFLRGSAATLRVRAGAAGAWLLLREADGTVEPFVQHESDSAWAPFAPGVRRRVLHEAGGVAAMLYRSEPEAVVPRHAHGHDEECLMLQGDLFLDDVLLRPLDYQLAPAGSMHGGVYTDTGMLLYAHGDAELDLRPA
jgi:quercetin dioxygenase-like cupin family protein